MRGRGRLAVLALVAGCRRRRARRRPTTSPSTCARSARATRCGGFAADGSNELLSRRRLTQYLDLNVFDIAPARWHGDDGDRNLFYFDASLRFDSDFGGYMLGRPTGTDEIRELQQSQLDILYAFLGGRNVGGRVDFQLGRQIHFDLVDFYAFDGGDALVHVTPQLRRRGVRRAPRCAASCRCRRRSTSSTAPAPARAIRRRGPTQNAMLRPLVGARGGGRQRRRAADGAARLPAGLVGDRRPAAGRARRRASTTRSCR